MRDPRANKTIPRSIARTTGLGLAGSALLAVSGGCRPEPQEVPDDLTFGENVETMFRTFDTNPEGLAELIENTEQQMDTFDLDGELADRKFVVDVLDPTGLDITFPTDADPNGQTPILVMGVSRHAFEVSISPALEDNQVCIESESTVSFDRTWLEGEACFKDGSCDVARTVNRVRKELSFIASGWYDIKKDLRRVTLSDGREAMIARAWTEQIYCGDAGNNKFAQTYTLELWIGDGATTKRLYAGWMEIDIGLGETAMTNLIGDSLDEGIQFGDNWVDMELADYCKNDPDESFDGGPTDTCK